jgi:hypothetical protein
MEDVREMLRLMSDGSVLGGRVLGQSVKDDVCQQLSDQ